MSVAFDVRVHDGVSPELQRLMDRATDNGHLDAMGRSVANLVRDHLAKFNAAHPNRMGGTRTNFYAQASKATSHEVTGDGAMVTVAQQGIRQRLFGGEIHPVNAKWLTIPARAEAYGHRASDFNNLRFVVLPGGGAALIEGERSDVKIGRAKKDGSRSVKKLGEAGGGVMFWLRKSVTQEGDPDVIPSDGAMADCAVWALGKYLEI